MAEDNPTETPNLSSFSHVSLFNRGNIPFGHTIMNMQASSFHTWGFVVYRCLSGDAPAWDRFLAHMKQATSEKLARRGQRELLEQYLDWTVIGNIDEEEGGPPQLPSIANASKQEIRKRFTVWCQGRSIERDGPGAEHPIAAHLPRFTFCVVVDALCLETLQKWDCWVKGGRRGQQPIVVVILLDADCDQHGKGKTGFPDVEGCTREYTGWMYADVGSLPGLYEKLHHGGLVDELGEYARPPLVYPGHQHGASIS